EQAAELEAREQLARAIERNERKWPRASGGPEIDVVAQARERDVELDFGRVALEAFTHAPAADVTNTGEHPFDATIGLQQRARGARTDAGHVRDVVRRIAEERGERGELLGCHAEAIDDRGAVVELGRAAAAADEQHADALVHELEQIAVSARDQH